MQNSTVLNSRNAIIPVALLVLLLLGMGIFSQSVNAATTLTLNTSGSTQTTITLYWGESTDLFFSKYELYFSSIGVNGPFSKIWSTTDKSEHEYAITGLSPNTKYWFYVKDIDSFGSANSITHEASTNANPTLSITAQTTTTASLSWTDSNDYSALVSFDGFVVQMSTSGASGPWSSVTTITDSAQKTYAITGLSVGRYYFRMYNKVSTPDGTQTAYSNIEPMSIISVAISTSSNTAIYLGQQVQFIASPEGGTGSYNYQWYANGNTVASSTSSFTFSPTQTGAYSIYVVAQDASYEDARATSNSITVTVNPAPTPTPSIPELPSFIVLPSLTALTLIGALLFKRKGYNKSM